VPEGVGLTFEGLVPSIRGIDAEMTAQAGRAVNVSLTLRNRLIGCYSAEYELSGAARARYGAKLLENLSARLKGLGVIRTFTQDPNFYPNVQLAREIRCGI
jgi:hypothetical protein